MNIISRLPDDVKLALLAAAVTRNVAPEIVIIDTLVERFSGEKPLRPDVAARRDAIRKLKAECFDNREIANRLKLSITTVRYWTNPKIRTHRVAYKALVRAEYGAE